MVKHAITGPVKISEDQEGLIIDKLMTVLADADEFTSGAAEGVDTVGALVASHVSVSLIRLTVPRAWHNVELVKLGLELGWTIEYAARGHTDSESYMLRNDLTIARATSLSAFPETSVERQFSGTWATVRRARKAGIEIVVTPLDGSTPWVEAATA